MRQSLLRLSLFALVALGVVAPRAAFAESVGPDTGSHEEAGVPFAPDTGTERMPDVGVESDGGSGAPIFDVQPTDATSTDPRPDSGVTDIPARPDAGPEASTTGDAATTTDSGSSSDGATAVDAAADAPSTMASGGCSVATPGSSGARGALALASLGFAAVVARRLRRARR